MLIKTSIAFDMGTKLSTPDLTADLPLDCFKLFVKERKKKERKEKQREINFITRFTFIRIWKLNQYIMYMCVFLSKTEFNRR